MVPLDPKDWQLLALGALISFLLSLVIASLPDIRAFARRLSGHAPEERPLLRTWHTYHFTRNKRGVPFLRYERWEMSRRLFGLGRIGIHTHDPLEPNLTYRGTVRREHNTAVFFLKAEHIETAYVRFRYPLVASSNERICGLLSGIDFKIGPYSTAVLISSEQVSDDEATVFLTEHVEYISAEVVLRPLL